jgi:O-antigen/teichoic acid export membrane protein
MNAGLIVVSEQDKSDASTRLRERRSESDSRRFSVNVAFTLGTRLLMLASALCTSIIVARWLGAAGVGALAVLNVTVALAVQVGSGGLPSANTFFISQNRTRVGAVWANSLVFSILVGGMLAGIVILAVKFQSSLLGNVSNELVTVAAVSVPFQLITLLGNNIFLGIGRIQRFNQIDAANQLALLINSVIALILLGLGLLSLVLFNTVAAALLSLLLVLMIRDSVRNLSVDAVGIDLKLFKRMMKYAIKFHISTLAALIIFRADLLIVNHFRGEKEAGAYAVASQMGNLLMLLPAIIGTLLFPRVAAERDPQGGMTMRVTRHTAFIMLFACLAAVPLSFALPFVYGRDFQDSTAQLLILLPGVYFIGLESVMVQHFTGTGLPVVIPLFWIVALALNLTLNFLLIPTFGAIAAAITSTLSYTLVFVLVAAYFRSNTGNPLTVALLLRRDEFRDLVSPIRLAFFSRQA